MSKTLSSKERVKTAFARSIPDRVPINYSSNPGIDARLKKHYGLEDDDAEGLRLALGVDFRWVGAPFVGPPVHQEIPDQKVDPVMGIRTRYIEHSSGGYWDYCDFPLMDADDETLANWPLASADQFDYDKVKEQCRRHKDYAIVVGHPGFGDIINSCGMLRTMEQVMIDLAVDNAAFWRFVDRKINLNLEVLRRTLEAGGGEIDVLHLGEDLGTQIGPIISLDMYRKFLRPRHQRLVDLGKHFGIPVMIHCCGSSSWVFDDFIEMGVSVVDTLQPEAKNMASGYLKKRFGDRLAFHGCISTAGPVASGSVKDVIANVKQTLEIMMPGGGYALAPTHQLQDNSPTENVVAMYETAKTRGRYR